MTLTLNRGIGAAVSDQQLGAIMGSGKMTATRLILVDGPQPIPEWVLDIQVNWLDAYSNRPEVVFKAAYDPMRIKDHDYRWYRVDKAKGLYMKTSPDGFCASSHYHKGSVSEVDIDVGPKKDAEGNAIRKEGGKPWEYERELVRKLATQQQNGYGGRHYPIRMADDSDFHPGKEIILRGPWHGSAPAGFVEVTMKFADDRFGGLSSHKGDDWHKWMGYFGFLIPEQTYLDILATFRPELPMFLVDLGYARRIEPGRPETGLPKEFYVPVDKCPGHKYNGEQCFAKCLFCDSLRDEEETRRRYPHSMALPENKRG